ncbi:hypothetical protein GHT07_15435 [Caenimonas koreensis DSM 17982]|uniref:Uncharacterized protein n=1 Tax=Caenimonas koreensis DSM 17982 TaxID=1121255 RepID=A0A844BDX5_9BURK|nr:hypothetical protein [Caenimonas koreensis]MRD48681.1 hypothetical protein [Caenimonas koreensis DSM 17982]
MSSPPINPQAAAGLRPALPAAAAPTAAASGDQRHAASWQREMEQAQMALWFAHGVIGYQPFAPTAAPEAPKASAAPASIASPSSIVKQAAHHAQRRSDTPTARADAPAAHASATPRHDAYGLAAPAHQSLQESPAPRPTATITQTGDIHFRAALVGTQKMADELRSFGPVVASVGRPSFEDMAGAIQLVSENGQASGRASAPAQPEIATHSSMALASTTAAVAATSATAASTNMAAMPVSESAAPQAMAPSSAAPLAAAEPLASAQPIAAALPAQPQAQPQAQAQTQLLSRSPQQASVDAPSDAAEPEPSRASGTRAAPTPIRLHADWSADGIRLWLGMHADMLPHLDAIAAQLQRWVNAQGLKMLSLACNGKDLRGHALAGAPAPDLPSPPTVQRTRS